MSPLLARSAPGFSANANGRGSAVCGTVVLHNFTVRTVADPEMLPVGVVTRARVGVCWSPRVLDEIELPFRVAPFFNRYCRHRLPHFRSRSHSSRRSNRNKF